MARLGRALRLEDLSPALQAQIAEKLGTATPVTPRAKTGQRRGKFNVSAKEHRTFEGIVFDSKWEMRVHRWLKVWIPKTSPIRRQVPIILQEKTDTMRAIKLVADFAVGGDIPEVITKREDIPDNCVLIDAKGMLTSGFRVKHKLFQARYGQRLFLPKTVRDLERFQWRQFKINAL